MIGTRPSSTWRGPTILPGPIKIVCNVLRVTTESWWIFKITVAVALCKWTLKRKIVLVQLRLLCSPISTSGTTQSSANWQSRCEASSRARSAWNGLWKKARVYVCGDKRRRIGRHKGTPGPWKHFPLRLSFMSVVTYILDGITFVNQMNSMMINMYSTWWND